jgi:hypothetical protein
MDSSALNNKPVASKGALDKALAYGADCEFLRSPPLDPWGRDCLQTMIDVLVNHDECYYLLPTVKAAADPQVDMPQTLSAAWAAALVKPATNEVAELVELTPEFALEQFAVFKRLVQSQERQLIQFDAYHLSKRKAHDQAMPGSVLRTTQDFWRANFGEVMALKVITPLPMDELRYLFDSAVRVSAYQTIAAAQNALYFSHPIRDGFGIPSNASSLQCEGSWWGGIVSRLLREERIQNDPAALMNTLAAIRESVRKNKATVYDLKYLTRKDRDDCLTAAACDAGIPANLRDGLVKNLLAVAGGSLWALGHVYTGTFVMISSLLTPEEITVPGTVVRRFKVARGMFRWPTEGTKAER